MMVLIQDQPRKRKDPEAERSREELRVGRLYYSVTANLRVCLLIQAS